MKPIYWLLGAGAVVGGYLLWKRSAATPAIATRVPEPVLTDPKSSGQYQATYAGSSDGIELYDVRLVGYPAVILTYSQRGAERKLVAAPGPNQAEIFNLSKLYNLQLPA